MEVLQIKKEIIHGIRDTITRMFRERWVVSVKRAELGADVGDLRSAAAIGDVVGFIDKSATKHR